MFEALLASLTDSTRPRRTSTSWSGGCRACMTAGVVVPQPHLPLPLSRPAASHLAQAQQGIPVGQKQDPPQQHIAPRDLGSCLFPEVGLWLHSGPLEPEQTPLSIITFYHPQGFRPGRTASPQDGGAQYVVQTTHSPWWISSCVISLCSESPPRGTGSDLIISLPFVPDCVALTALVSWPVSS